MEKKQLSDKAIETRRKNAEKARQGRLTKQAEQQKIVDKYKQELENNSSDSDSSSEEEEETITYNKKSTTKQKTTKIDYEDRIRELENKVLVMSQPHKKTKQKTIYIETPGPEKVVEKIVEKRVLQKDQMIDHLKKKILNF
jgi:CRISPR/Cas system-associated endonuclease/helicase Cas3